MPNLLPALIISFAWIVSVVLSGFPLVFGFHESWELGAKLLALAVAPLIFLITFPSIMGLISIPFQKGIVSGKFKRLPYDPVYFCRRVYGVCWSQVFYFKPIYSAVLAIPVLREFVFRLFGCKGASGFIVYPDTWIRDLPLLKIERGAYISNRVTMGTNIVLRDGNIFVGGIEVGERALIGHLSIVGPLNKFGKDSQVGIRCTLGINVQIEEQADIKSAAGINHQSVVKKGAVVGAMAFIGSKCTIGEGVKVPAGALIPNGTSLDSQKDADRFFSSEISELKKFKDMMIQMMRQADSNE